jgi:two-component system, OmpR family, phosphate regulon sensor histidine kinase PhoR
MKQKQLQFKNQTPQQLSIIAALTSASAVCLVVTLLDIAGLFSITWAGTGLLFLTVIGIDYLANFFFVRHYIFRRIKLIYKIIHREKTPSDFKSDKIQMRRDIMNEIEQEVDEWAERSAREFEEMEKLATYRRRFIGDVSHELKTPIFNIQGFIHTLLDGALNDPEVNQKYLKRAARNVERLQNIVEDLETINKLEAGQLILDLREFDIYDLTQEVFTDLELKATERNIRLEFKDGADAHIKVRADLECIRQVLINLIQNSIKYGTEGGITKVSFYDLEGYILVEVSDTGQGIQAEHLPHVFDRFYRVDKSRSRDAGGTGLGLSIVKHIIEAHKQTINVRSSLGQGSTFGFTLEKV